MLKSKIQNPKSKIQRPPNLPQHNLPEPYSRLLDLGSLEEDETFEKMAAELRAGDAGAAVQQLIALVLDDTFYGYADKYADFTEYMNREKRMYVPSQAVRVLTFMGEAGQAAIEPLLPLLNSEDDFLREELPFFYGAMGEAAIAPLTRALNEVSSDEYLRGGAGECLTEVAEKRPDLRDRVVSILEQTLSSEKDDDELNGFLVCNLIDLMAIESYPIIEKAYDDDLVDESIVGLRDVQEHFGMPLTAEVSQGHWEPDGMEELGSPLPPLPFQPAQDYDEEPAEQPFVATAKPGRNDPCYCGSGKKYKKCHGA